uniref:Uncharacterized protein n=1 Tax=Ananas comosus var. bracteatus TaxID=296719 RepID=A0A6V7QB35_ANACO|nr:unnamed protein product [Ananas comosus var. bracteatus]
MDSQQQQQEQQEQQMAAVLGPDPAPFEALVASLMSSGNAERSAAESLFHLCRDRHPDPLSLRLAHLLHPPPPRPPRHVRPPPPQAPLLLLLLLRFLFLLLFFFNDDAACLAAPLPLHPVLPQIPPAVCPPPRGLQVHLQEALRRRLRAGGLPPARERLARAAAFPLPVRRLPASPHLQESALLVFARLADYIADSLRQYLPTIHDLLLASLSTPPPPTSASPPSAPPSTSSSASTPPPTATACRTSSPP